MQLRCFRKAGLISKNTAMTAIPPPGHTPVSLRDTPLQNWRRRVFTVVLLWSHPNLLRCNTTSSGFSLNWSMPLAGREEFAVSQSCVDMPAFSKRLWVTPQSAALHNADLSPLPVHAAIITVYIGRNITKCLGDCAPSPK